MTKNWSAREKEELIERAVEIYLMKRRKTKTCEPPQKVRIIQLEENDDDSDNSSSISDEELQLVMY